MAHEDSPQMRFTIKPDIHVAQTPPAHFYRSLEVFEQQRGELFPSSWQLVMCWPEPNEAIPFRLLDGLLDEPLLLAREGEQPPRCLSNVCTHRGNILLDSACKSGQIRCGYHGRRFDSNGKLTHAPGFEHAADFPSATDDLPSPPIANLGPLSFTSLNPSTPFQDWIAPVLERCPWLKDMALPGTPQHIQDYEIQANWMVYCDNYLEGFHVPFVHPSLQRTLETGSYETHLFPWASAQTSKPGPNTPALPDGQAAWYFWLFPNTMVNVYPWGVSMNVVLPTSVSTTRVRFLSYVAKPALQDAGAGGDLDQVEAEDEAVVESVQRGLQSRLYARGRYSPTHEQAVHHFHRLLTREPSCESS